MIRPYSIKDKEALIHILRLNTPEYFEGSEEKDFIAYLDKDSDNYFVVEENNKIIGSGGINYFDDYNLARISWDIIHEAFSLALPPLFVRSRTLFLFANFIRKPPTLNTLNCFVQ